MRALPLLVLLMSSTVSAQSPTPPSPPPAAAAAPSSLSTSCAEAPCGAPESTSQCGAERSRSIVASIDTKSSWV